MTDSNATLAPCPFCGGEASIYEEIPGGYIVQCHDCCGQIGIMTREHAIADWNARAERTCRMEYQTDGMLRGWWRCSECGGAMDTIEACGGRKPPRWCGNCGAKVVFGCNDREGAQEMIITYTSSTRHGECKECGKSFIRRAIEAGDDGKLCRDCYLKQKDKQR